METTKMFTQDGLPVSSGFACLFADLLMNYEEFQPLFTNLMELVQENPESAARITFSHEHCLLFFLSPFF